MLRKYLIVLLGAVLILGFFNYDKIAAKVLKRLPDKVDNALAEMFLPDKFWLHRVNSVGKQMEFSSKYAGLEFDIIFHSEAMSFENSHDPDCLDEFNFEKQLAVFRNLKKQNGMWLDFKNLTENKKKDALFVMEDLLSKYDIDKSKIWIESSNWEALNVFKTAGFKTSYYFPYYKFNKMNDKEIGEIRQKTETIAKSGNIDAISFYGGYYDFINTLELPPRIALLSWLNGQEWMEVLLLRKYADVRNDERIRVILVKDLGKYNR